MRETYVMRLFYHSLYQETPVIMCRWMHVAHRGATMMMQEFRLLCILINLALYIKYAKLKEEFFVTCFSRIDTNVFEASRWKSLLSTSPIRLTPS